MGKKENCDGTDRPNKGLVSPGRRAAHPMTRAGRYAAGAEHSLKQPCVAMLEEIAQDRFRAVTDVEVVQEMLHRYTAVGQRARTVEVARLFLQIMPEALPITKAYLLVALDLLVRYPALTARDTIHLAVMQQHGLTHIASADRHFDNLSGIIRFDPAQWQVQDS